MIRVEKLSFATGDFRLRGVGLDVAPGEYFVLLGPPGSGKTVLLECLCGLNRPGSGRIYIDGRDVTELEPRERGIGYVPQDYALFPHLSVERNIGFGLRGRGCAREEIGRKVSEVAEMLGIRHLLKRRVAGLSGGERQRVALARALAVEPKVLLLDEPVSALDESTRESVCSELRRLQRELGLTTVHVSHNLEEAFSVSDRAGLLQDGMFQQIGPLDELLRRPRNEFVARFMRCENLFQGAAAGQGADPTSTRVRVAEVEFALPGRHEGRVKFMVRPENVRLALSRETTGRDDAELPLKIARTVDRGSYVRLELDGALKLVAHVPPGALAELRVSTGSELFAVVRREAIHVLEGG